MSPLLSSQAPDGSLSIDSAAASTASDADAQALGPEEPLPPAGPVVLDASFVLALLQRHRGATALAHMLPRGVMTSVTAGEVIYRLAATTAIDSSRVEGVLRALGVNIVDLNLNAVRHFPQLRSIDAARRAEQKANAEKAVTLSLADLCVLGHALTTGSPVLTGDRHWATLPAHGLAVPVYLY